VRAPQGTDQRAILVPPRAGQRTSDGNARVLVVGADERARSRSVRTGTMQGSRWQVSEGLQAGEQVIVGGLAGLQPSTKVAPQPAQEQQAKGH
ncbi:efflux transporter periplasmic adaptor subunit, partial [Pseudomonas sp. MWU13-2625]